MSRFGKGASGKHRGKRHGPGKRSGENNHGSRPSGQNGKNDGQQDRPRAAGDRPPKSQGHGEGHRHHRKGAPDRNRPHVKPFHRRDHTSDSQDRVRAELSEDTILKSRQLIKSWLSAGAELRQNIAASNKGPSDPKLLSLDPWQQQVFDLLRSGESVVVDAPTTAGKTRAVEVFFAMNIDDPTFRAAYTTPVKSLSNDKVRELRTMFGDDKVGIATGDIKENLDAPIVVATLESYRNSLLGIEPDLGRSLVVFDEYHYLQDEGRGSAWEEAIILTPPSCQVLLLSASVANAEEFADWISTQGKKRCTMVRTEHRPVPLTNLVYYSGHWLTEDCLPKDAFKGMNPARQQLPLRHADLVARLPALIDLDLTPCII